MRMTPLLILALLTTPVTLMPTSSEAQQRAPFATCQEVRDAGRPVLRQGQPGFNPALDTNGNGIACDEPENRRPNQNRNTNAGAAAPNTPGNVSQGAGTPGAGNVEQPIEGIPQETVTYILPKPPEVSCALETMCLRGLSRNEAIKAKSAGIDLLPAVGTSSPIRATPFTPPGQTPAPGQQSPEPTTSESPTINDGEDSGSAMVRTQSTVTSITGAREERQVRSRTTAFYSDCDAARTAGVAPLMRGERGYDRALDRNDNGVACEDGE